MSTAEQRHEEGRCEPQSCRYCWWEDDLPAHVEDAPCNTCQAPVHLQHDPPCDHGTVTCPGHYPAPCCEEEEAAS